MYMYTNYINYLVSPCILVLHVLNEAYVLFFGLVAFQVGTSIYGVTVIVKKIVMMIKTLLFSQEG